MIWVRKFFRATENWKPDSWDVLLQQFINELRDKPEVEEWQVSQAEQAVRLYFANFRNGTEVPGQNTGRIELAKDGSVSSLEVVSAVKESLRIQHYSYRTEQTYLDWVRRFFAYVQSCDLPDGPGRPTDADSAAVSQERVKVDQQGIKDYLGHANVETTMIYTQVVKTMRNRAHSPLDMLENLV